MLPVRRMNKESPTPLPPEKEARDSFGSLPSKRLRGPALYSFSLPILNVALNLRNTHVHRFCATARPELSNRGRLAQESLILPVPSNPTKIMTMLSTIVCPFMYSSWNAKSVAPHTVSDLKNDNAIIVNDSSRNIQLRVEIDPGYGHHVQTDRLPIRSGDSGSRTLLVVEPFAPRIRVKNLVQMKNRSGGRATSKSKGQRTGPHGSSRPKRHEKASHQLNAVLGCATFMGFHSA